MAQSEPDVILFLVGNKKDMEEQREVSLDRVEKFKKDRGIMFHFETSAKTGENIENLFIFASKVLYNSFKDKIEQMVSNFMTLIRTHKQNEPYATLSILTKRLFVQKAEQLQKKGGKKGSKKLTRKDVAATSES